MASPMKAPARAGVAVFGVLVGFAIWIDFAAVRALHVWGGVPAALMMIGQFAGLLAVPITFWYTIRRDHPHLHLWGRHS